MPRILSLFFGKGEWIPHFTSVINWTLRLGLSLLASVASIPEPWVAIMDHSIDVGVKKVLVVLRVKLSALQSRGSALTLEDCECIGLKIHEQSNGVIVAKDLKEIFEKAGTPVAIIKDGGSDLFKGVNLWKEENKKEQVEMIEDIGHVVANAIKLQYSQLKFFKLFIQIVNRCGKQLRQTKLAFLTPPKLRTKGRYQSISIFVKWAIKVIELFDNGQKSQELEKLNLTLRGLSRVKSVIQGFAQTVVTTSKIMEIQKNEGLNQATFYKSMELASTLPERSVVKKRVEDWLTTHIEVQKRMNIGNDSIIVSSDILESLFGKFKNILSRGSMMDMNRIVLLLPALCCKTKYEASTHPILNTTHKEIMKWDQENIPYTQNRRRRMFLSGNTDNYGPKTVGFYSQTG